MGIANSNTSGFTVAITTLIAAAFISFRWSVSHFIRKRFGKKVEPSKENDWNDNDEYYSYVFELVFSGLGLICAIVVDGTRHVAIKLGLGIGSVVSGLWTIWINAHRLNDFARMILLGCAFLGTILFGLSKHGLN
jgi:hypothetical protein